MLEPWRCCLLRDVGSFWESCCGYVLDNINNIVYILLVLNEWKAYETKRVQAVARRPRGNIQARLKPLKSLSERQAEHAATASKP